MTTPSPSATASRSQHPHRTACHPLRVGPLGAWAPEITFCVRGVISPLLSNILLTDLDRELERRGLAFCRYADDCNIYVGSRVAGERVMRGIRVFLEKVLHLRVNATKSAVARPWVRKFLGFSFTVHRETRLRIASESVQRLTERIRAQLRSARGRSLTHTIELLNPLLSGWINFFQIAQAKGPLEELDGWLRRRLRCLVWRQWRVSRILCDRSILPEGGMSCRSRTRL